MSADDGVQQRIDGYWTERAPAYDAWQRAPERVDRDRETWSTIWAGALPAAPCDVLDVGTGSAQVACVLAGLGHRVTGIDLSPGMLEVARVNAAREATPPTILRGDAVAPPLPDASVDVVTGRYVMWTLREPLAALAAWQRVLRPGGLVALVDSTWFPDGVGTHAEVGRLGMREWYDDAVLDALPVATAGSIEATADLLRAGGLRDVTVQPLDQLLALDRRRGVSPGHEVQLQYLLTGTTPTGA